MQYILLGLLGGGVVDQEFLILKNYQLHLQLFANPEDEGRTEDPTDRKKREKREEGEVAKSMDLTTSFVFLFSILGFWLFFDFFVKNILLIFKHYLSNVDHLSLNGKEFLFFNLIFTKGMLPVALITVVAAIFISVAQVGFLITPKAISPRFQRISFSFKKFQEKILFSKPMLLNLFFSIGKIIFLSITFIVLIHFHLKELLNLSGMGMEVALSSILGLVLQMCLVCGIFLFILGVPDYFSKRKQFKDSLKITKSEAKRELRQEEGNPQVKGYLREIYNKILQRQSIKVRIPESDVVITNPTHFAVALKYDMSTMNSPMVTAKGEDDTALLIREIAQQHGVQVLENPPLARELYRLVDVGDYIPEHLTMVIAEIFVQLYKEGKWNWHQESVDQEA